MLFGLFGRGDGRPQNLKVITRENTHDETALLRPVIYMGGYRDGTPSAWRSHVIEKLSDYAATLIDPSTTVAPNPRRDLDGHAEFVLWERSAIDGSDAVIMWLPRRMDNQAPRVEIGYITARKKHLIVGAEPELSGLDHLQCFTQTQFFPCLDQTIEATIEYIMNGNHKTR
ncbi:nucleoside 2-deoxyribosyltransferase domain-containing protein [Polymorphum gilvum]|uniref:nucleoside 2-deoxyribosyltransferase domain-containing protein n=1 Tax=Polymorphum gilvum TaxID=991904 RepID=UPI000A05CDA9|nr:nucleoside 2-deoxyribosyltransferase domain-containing protein [Polymorphum gilvum]